MDTKNVKRLKYACYASNCTMAVVANLPPILFLTFRNLYGISYSLLGTLVLVNFITQLGIDLIFSFFSHKFNIPRTVKNIPLLAMIGLVIYAIFPLVYPDGAYFGLLLGTVIFSLASGLSEVLISPVIAALPADDSDREMSKLHSTYAWGTVGVIIIASLSLLFLKKELWYILPLVFVILPLICAILFMKSEIPDMATPEKATGALKMLKNKGVWLSIFAIFLGGATECTMSQWSSTYLEKAFGIDKIWGDIFGVALFAVMLGLGRTLYAKYGKNIGKILTLGAIGSAVCYLLAAVSNASVIGLIACALTGFCASMLWPGNLVVAANKFPSSGLFIYAVMAAGGDLGASFAPQMVGVITDTTIDSSVMQKLADELSVSPEQLGMKIGMLCAMLFPIIAIFVYGMIWKKEKKNEVQK